MRPICVPCGRFFKCSKNGFEFTEGMQSRRDETPNVTWVPYKLWQGDKYECPGCKAEIIVGVARQPFGEHFESDFEEVRRKVGADKFMVKG